MRLHAAALAPALAAAFLLICASIPSLVTATPGNDGSDPTKRISPFKIRFWRNKGPRDLGPRFRFIQTYYCPSNNKSEQLATLWNAVVKYTQQVDVVHQLYLGRPVQYYKRTMKAGEVPTIQHNATPNGVIQQLDYIRRQTATTRAQIKSVPAAERRCFAALSKWLNGRATSLKNKLSSGDKKLATGMLAAAWKGSSTDDVFWDESSVDE